MSLALSQPTWHSPPRHSESPLLRLPAEIRLMIYDHLFLPSAAAPPPSPSHLKVLHQDRRNHYESSIENYTSTLRVENKHVASIRTLDPTLSPLAQWHPHRSKYLIRTSRFRSQTKSTTYTVHPAQPHLASSIALLRTCRTLYHECTAHLYSNYTFDFSTHIEAIVPFLQDLSPLARACIRHVCFTKRALPYCTEADRAEWKEAMRWMAAGASGLTVNGLTVSLGVMAGKPGLGGWEDVPELGRRDFDAMLESDDGDDNPGQNKGRLRLHRDHHEEMRWASQLAELKGIRELRVRALVEHSPLPESAGMMFWILVSKSVEGGFREWLVDAMVGRER